MRQNGVRLPKWLVVSLLVSPPLLLILAMASWWILWPRQTAQVFVVAFRSRNQKQMEELLVPDKDQQIDAVWLSQHKTTVNSESALEWMPRNLHDLLVGRQKFVIQSLPLTFTIERGTVTVERFRRVSLAGNEALTLTLWDYVKRIAVDSPGGVNTKVNKQNPAEIVLVGVTPSESVNVHVTDRSGFKYELQVRVLK